jgi:uncharacterized protein YhdP
MEKVKAKLVELLENKSGQGAKGEWQIQTALLETNEKYPRKLAVQFWNELADKIKSCPKDVEVEFSVKAESREYQGKWYSDIKGVDVELPVSKGKKAATVVEDEGLDLPF